ncbi:MAG: sulfotransferase [Aliidongia sp.]
MKTVFLVGCPRSGTTWLQIILGSHPGIATVRETHLFDRYLADIYARYESEAQKIGKDGLRILLGEDKLDRLCRNFADGVLAEIAATKPGCSVVLEKTASQIWSTQLMRRLYPEAYFLHIVRDPRAVAASMLAYARESWANEGEPRRADSGRGVAERRHDRSSRPGRVASGASRSATRIWSPPPMRRWPRFWPRSASIRSAMTASASRSTH